MNLVESKDALMYNDCFKTYQFKGRIHYLQSEVSSQEPPQLCWVSKSEGGARRLRMGGGVT